MSAECMNKAYESEYCFDNNDFYLVPQQVVRKECSLQCDGQVDKITKVYKGRRVKKKMISWSFIDHIV